MNWTTTAICYFYFLCVGGLYLYGFWAPLHFNILQFLSPLDVIKSAVYPLVPTLLTILAYSAMDAFNSQGVEKPEEDEVKAIKGLYYAFILVSLIGFLLLVFVVAATLWEAIVTTPEKRLLFALPVISIVVTIYLVSNPPKLLQSKKKVVRNFGIIFTCLLPTYSHTAGYKEVISTIDESKALYYLKESTKSCKVGTGVSMIFLGMYGENYFFFNPANRDVCIENQSSVLLKLKDANNK